MAREPRGLLVPFRRDKKSDFASGVGADLLHSDAEQVLGTQPGELPWRTEFGTELDRLRHRQNTEIVRELGRVYTRDALRRWLPTAELTEFSIRQSDVSLRPRVGLRARGAAAVVEVER
jgi:uncharacterized protein